MSGAQIPPPGPAAPSSPSAAAGLVALPSEIVRLPQELAARLLNGHRTVFVSGTVTGQGADGALNIRSQFGEIALRAGTAVPADRQVTLQIPPLSGRAATLTPPQLGRNPIPASLLFSRPPASQPASTTAGEASQLNTGSPAAARPAPISGAPIPGSPIASAPTDPSPLPAPYSGPAAAAPTAGPGSAPLPGSVSVRPAQPAAGSAPPASIPAAPLPPQSGAAGTPKLGGPNLVTANLATPLPANLKGANPATSSTPASQPLSSPSASAPGQSAAPARASAAQVAPLAVAAQRIAQSGGPTPQGPASQNQEATAPRGALPHPQGTVSQGVPVQGPAGQGPAAPAGGAAPPPGIGPTSATDPSVPRPITGVRTSPPLPAASGAAHDRLIPLESTRRVPVLREAVSALGAADPALATQFVRSVLPQANTQLASTLLFFLSATRSGDVRGWMGDRVTSALETAGRADLLPRLSAELASPARTVPDAPAGEWRTQTIPLYQDGDIGGMTVHVRRDGNEGGEAGDEEAAGHRFLIEMDFSRMGPLQFDGRVHRSRFDLTIRSPAAFPEPMRQDMRTLFRDASTAVGLHGGLTFQAGGHDWASVATARG